MTEFEHPWGTLTLQRWPLKRQDALQAWDNADLYLLKTLADRGEGTATLCLNDSWGALALAASQHGEALSCGDSWLAWKGMAINAQTNGLAPPQWCWPQQALDVTPDQIVLKVPKSVALLESQLDWIAQNTPGDVPVWLAGMDKHLPRQLVPLLERFLGNGRAEYGWKKARLFSARTPGQSLAQADYPSTIDSPFGPLVVHAGVFSQSQLDIGARCFLDHLPKNVTPDMRVADLGCGNGVMGLAMLAASPGCRVTFCDESWLALQSARENVDRHSPNANARFHLGDGLKGAGGPFDLILLNPPFHEGHVVGDHVARRLFRQASESLAPDGELRVIGNRHLGYHTVLQRLFESVEVAGSNRKFVVWACRLPRGRLGQS